MCCRLIPQSHGCMEQYAGIIGNKASSEDYTNIATYFDDKGDHFMAGKFYFSAKVYNKVSKLAHIYRTINGFCESTAVMSACVIHNSSNCTRAV